jgi:hypothetical protein
MQMVGVDHAVSVELNFQLDLIAPNRFTADGTYPSTSRSAEHAVGRAKRQTTTPDNISRLISEFGLVRHMRGGSIARSPFAFMKYPKFRKLSRIGSPGLRVIQLRTWGAHERVAVKQG